MFFLKNHNKTSAPPESLQKMEAQISQLEDAIRQSTANTETTLNQLQNLDKQVSRHNMAVENLLDEIQDERESDLSVKKVADEHRECEENLLALIASYQEQFWQVRRFFSDKDNVWREQLDLMEQSLGNARIHCGITEINQTGIPVDYQLHEVIDLISSETQDKVVAEVYSPGYLYHGKVMKKAKIAAYRIDSHTEET